MLLAVLLIGLIDFGSLVRRTADSQSSNWPRWHYHYHHYQYRSVVVVVGIWDMSRWRSIRLPRVRPIIRWNVQRRIHRWQRGCCWDGPDHLIAMMLSIRCINALAFFSGRSVSKSAAVALLMEGSAGSIGALTEPNSPSRCRGVID